ncbi:unnamed protein product, partial [Staurois parvus]
MQVPLLGCTFLTLSDREESTAENRQLSERGSAPIIRALMISALMIGAQQCHPQVSAHLCPAFRPPVPSSAPTCAQQCTHLCHSAVSHTCAQKCHPPVPTYQCHPPVQPSSAASQCP